jgi:hypothetical protein
MKGWRTRPIPRPGVLLPAPKLRVGELYAQKHGKKVGAHITSIHRAVLTKVQDADGVPAKLHPGNAKAQKHPSGLHAHAVAVLLGDGLPSRLCYPGELRFANGAPAPCPGDGESRHPTQCDGAGGDAG